MRWLKEALRPAARRIINRQRSCFTAALPQISGATGLEIGGPSAIFAPGGPLPIYRRARRIDALNYAAVTFWSEFDDMGYRPSPDLEPGRQIVLDSSDLGRLPVEAYDFVAASHVLEHLANPIKTLIEWVRALRPGGAMILVVPQKKRTYDRDRPDTELEHLLKDYLDDVGEGDRTHFPEVIRNHNLKLDSTIGHRGELLARTMDNITNRILHHHVFTLELLISVGELAGLSPIGGTVIYPYHIVATFRKPLR